MGVDGGEGKWMLVGVVVVEDNLRNEMKGVAVGGYGWLFVI